MAGPKFGRAAGAAGVAAVLLAGAAPGAALADEHMFPVPETGAAGLLSLSSSIFPLVLPALEAGESFSWQIGVSVDQPNGESTLQLTADGEIAGTETYAVAVDECDVPWQGSSGLGGALSCPAGSTSRIAAVTLVEHRPDVLIPLRDVQEDTGSYLRFVLSRPPSSPDPQDATLALGIGITAGGAEGGGTPGQRPAVPLADTGAAVLQGLFAGGGLLLLGAAVVAATRGGRTTRRGTR
ncbi:hypothetical protein [Arthrobacter sp. MAHUQ-56]